MRSDTFRFYRSSLSRTGAGLDLLGTDKFEVHIFETLQHLYLAEMNSNKLFSLNDEPYKF